MGQLSATTQEVDDRLSKIADVAYISTPTATTSVGQTYLDMEGGWTDQVLEGFIINGDGNLEYNADIDLDMLCNVSGTVECSSPNITVFMAQSLNDSPTMIPGSEAFTLCKTANEPYALSGVFYVTLTKGDTLETKVKIDTGTASVTGTITFAASKLY